MDIRYAHTNIVAKDWRSLVRFYEEVLGCVPIFPERDHSGTWIDQATGLKDVHIRGIHLRLPGYGKGGPTLEIFQYDSMPEPFSIQANTPGFSHIAFAVDDVPGLADKIIANGGSVVGALTRREIPGAGIINLQYLTDPEGNIVEIQQWEQLESQRE
ncbi:MAG: VOC family protein [Proteobacteria bacterium]|nr:VOC family protein [Pseudomonadota bacterium]